MQLKAKEKKKEKEKKKPKVFCKKTIDMDGMRFIYSKTIFPSVVS